MAIPEDMILKEGDALPGDRQTTVIDRNSSNSTWFISDFDPATMTFDTYDVFETLEEAILHAESLGRDYMIAEFELNMASIFSARKARRLEKR